MKCILNYPKSAAGKQILLEKTSLLNAKLVESEINNLDIDYYSKNIVIKKILEILKNSKNI